MNIQTQIQEQFNLSVNDIRNSLSEIKRFTLSQTWKVLQVITGRAITVVESNAANYPGDSKKQIALNIISTFYDSVFIVVDIPLVPRFLEAIIHIYVKKILMMAVSATIDAMVFTFKENGILNNNTKEPEKQEGVIP